MGKFSQIHAETAGQRAADAELDAAFLRDTMRRVAGTIEQEATMVRGVLPTDRLASQLDAVAARLDAIASDLNFAAGPEPVVAPKLTTAPVPECGAFDANGLEECLLAKGHVGKHCSPWGEF